MAEVNKVHEVEVPVERRRGSFIFPFIMFLLGGALIAVAVVAVLNVHSIIAWPAGQVNLGPSSTVADSGNTTPVPAATATAPSVIAPSAIPSEPPTVDTTPSPAATTQPPATDDSESQSSTPPPADTTTPPE
jgi:hypothetical protein